MSLLDLVDAANEILPRRWKRCLAAGAVVAFLVYPSGASRVLFWYANEGAQQVVQPLVNVTIPDPAPIDRSDS
jgi:hypothetical protein